MGACIGVVETHLRVKRTTYGRGGESLLALPLGAVLIQ